jgi:hypothetical protein
MIAKRICSCIVWTLIVLFWAFLASIWIPMMVQSGWFDVDTSGIIQLGLVGVVGALCGISWLIGWHDRRDPPSIVPGPGYDPERPVPPLDRLDFK